MIHSRRASLLNCCSILLVICVACRSSAQSRNAPIYDGRWWTTASAKEREGFVAGFIDCYSAEANGPARFDAKSIVAYRDLVSAYFNSARRDSENVSDVLSRVADRPGEKAPRGGEVWTNPHTYFDGMYWVGISSTEQDQQLGFVEGYLNCYGEIAGHPHGTFSKPAREYRDRISKWYHFDPRTADSDERREDEKIASVLYRMHDERPRKS